jgi:hypothetical protein
MEHQGRRTWRTSGHYRFSLLLSTLGAPLSHLPSRAAPPVDQGPRSPSRLKAAEEGDRREAEQAQLLAVHSPRGVREEPAAAQRAALERARRVSTPSEPGQASAQARQSSARDRVPEGAAMPPEAAAWTAQGERRRPSCKGGRPARIRRCGGRDLGRGREPEAAPARAFSSGVDPAHVKKMRSLKNREPIPWKRKRLYCASRLFLARGPVMAARRALAGAPCVQWTGSPLDAEGDAVAARKV